jgi:ABC-type multidrug transport system ATPase subunit
MPAIEVDGLTKRYDQRAALDRVSLSLDEGECLALLGPNGAGKSTLIDILATIQTPTEGRALVLEEDVTASPQQVRRRVGVAFQRPIAHDHLTARELVVHQARLYALDREAARDRADELLAFVGLADRADDRLKTFSEGMKRRADLARVLATDPDVLLLDEPTAGLDPRGRRAIRERLTELGRQGTTLLVATHQMRDLDRLADRVAILHEGRIEALARPDELRARLGDRVLRVEAAPEDDLDALQAELADLGVDAPRTTGAAIEAILDADDPAPETLVAELTDRPDVDAVSVRAPHLGDVFLEVTGQALDEEGSR